MDFFKKKIMASNISDENKLSPKEENTNATGSSQEAEPSASSTPKPSKLSEQLKKAKNLAKSMSMESGRYWDPLGSSDWDAAGPPCLLASTRIRRDLSALFKEPIPGIFAIPEEENFCLVHCLVLGPFETPYEGGFFHFTVRFGPSYPIHPPRVRLMTTGAGHVRFNPNLYSNGKVCLSILGTWSGPLWSPALNLGSLLLSIQSLLNDKPYYNEPGFKTERFHGECDRYNQYITHETIRVAVCGQLEEFYCDSRTKKIMPSQLAEVMKESFFDLYEDYVETCNKNLKLDGTSMTNAFNCGKSKLFEFSKLLTRLKILKERLSNLTSAPEGEKDKESSLSSISDEDGESSKAEEVNVEAIIEEANEFADGGSPEATGLYVDATVDDDLDLFLGGDDSGEDYFEDEEDDNNSSSKEDAQN